MGFDDDVDDDSPHNATMQSTLINIDKHFLQTLDNIDYEIIFLVLFYFQI